MQQWLANGISFPNIRITDILEIIIIAVIVYEIMVWIKSTKTWMLLKGLMALGLFILIAYLLNLHTILWLAEKSIAIMATAIIVVLQPELRRALEKLGEKKFISSVVPFNQTKENERFSDQTINALVTAAFAMGRVKTGALIVVEQEIKLSEYEHTGIMIDGVVSSQLLINIFEHNTPLHDGAVIIRGDRVVSATCYLPYEHTGIMIDGVVSSQLLINIFEHNTPLHDGAVIIRGDRVVSATCYLPLTDNLRLSKDLGTRHRAAVGMSEVSDSMIIAVSEETGFVSIAMGGKLDRNVSKEYLTERLIALQNKTTDKKSFALWKGRRKDEKKADK